MIFHHFWTSKKHSKSKKNDFATLTIAPFWTSRTVSSLDASRDPSGITFGLLLEHFWSSFLWFWVLLGGSKMMKNHVFLEPWFFIKKTWFFGNRALAAARRSFLRGQGRFGRSPEPTKIEKMRSGTSKKTCFFENKKTDDFHKKIRAREPSKVMLSLS